MQVALADKGEERQEQRRRGEGQPPLVTSAPER